MEVGHVAEGEVNGSSRPIALFFAHLLTLHMLPVTE